MKQHTAAHDSLRIKCNLHTITRTSIHNIYGTVRDAFKQHGEITDHTQKTTLHSSGFPLVY